MHIKRFRGSSLSEALKEVKATFGEDAVIISTKNHNGLSEVIAAIDFDVEEIEQSLDGAATFKKSLEEVKAELNELRSRFAMVAGTRTKQEIASLGGSAMHVYDELVSSGLHEKLSQRLIKLAAHATNDAPEVVRSRCLKMIMDKTAVYNPLAGNDDTKILSLVGPSGAGKTSTILKIAGGLKRRYEAKVGVISLSCGVDSKSELLSEYSRRFGISVERARSKEDFNKQLWAARENDVILIDTPGVNPVNNEAIEEIGSVLNGGLPIKTALVLSLTASTESRMDACKGFSKLPLDCLVFTRMDEARRFGTIMNTQAVIKKPVAYLCGGREIPRDIKVATKETIGNLVLK